MKQKPYESDASYPPDSIWALDESDRPAVMTAQFKECAKLFRDAVQQDDAATAQELAIYALALVAGLFPDSNDESHVLLQSVAGVLLAAKSGRSDHILMKSTSPILGTRRGYGHAHVGGFAISAVNMLTDRGRLSGRVARTRVAAILSGLGYSLRKGEHQEAKPMTASAIRNWQDNPEDFPLHHEIAVSMANIHEENLARRKAASLDELLTYLADQAREALHHSRSL